MNSHNIIKEYIESVYDGFDTSIINFPTAAGAMNYLLKIIINKLQETKQTTLILARNRMMQEHLYYEFYTNMNEIEGKKKINTFYEFDNGSVIFFKIYNQVEHPIFVHANNVVFFNVDIKKNNKLNLEMLDKIKNYDKKLFIDCNIRDGVERVIARKLNGNLYQRCCNYDISDLPMEIRKFKLQKLKEKLNENKSNFCVV